MSPSSPPPVKGVLPLWLPPQKVLTGEQGVETRGGWKRNRGGDRAQDSGIPSEKGMEKGKSALPLLPPPRGDVFSVGGSRREAEKKRISHGRIEHWNQ